MTVGEWIRQARARLDGLDAPALEAQLLAAHVLLRDRSWVLAHPEEPFNELAGETLLMRRLAGEPLPYILGSREFYGRRFSVRPGVLIPRPETEHLVEQVLAADPVPRRILDIGTGSGAIAITLKLELPASEVLAVDLSPIACEIARQNAADLGADLRIVEGDFLVALEEGPFDWVVSNPPYVAPTDDLGPGVREFEPALALFAEESGLAFYRRLANEIRFAPVVAVEIGRGQATAAVALFEQAGWVHAATTDDLAGIERVLRFQRTETG